MAFCDNCGMELAENAKFCENCGEELSIRADDAPEVVLKRLANYHESTEPLKDYYEKKGKLKIVIGQEKLEDTTALTQAALEG